MHLAITIWAIIASWRSWTWKHFYEFHATIIYVSAMNLLYIYFTTGYILWEMQPDLGLPLSIVDMMYTFIIFPCTAILFLTKYPTIFSKKVYHILKWITIYIVVEWIGHVLNRITYENGWNLWWSLLFLIMMFPMFRLHYKRPLLAYLLTIIFIFLILYFFQVPLSVPVEDRL